MSTDVPEIGGDLIEHLQADPAKVAEDAEAALVEAERIAFVLALEPTTAEEYRTLAVAEISRVLETYRERLATSTGTFRLAPSALAEYDRTVWAVLDVLREADIEREYETDRALRARLALMKARADAATRINVLRALDDALTSTPCDPTGNDGDEPAPA